jgi:hypothetical protein
VSEDVYGIVQLASQAGSVGSPGSAAAATLLFPISDQIQPDLDLGAAYPALHRGRNVRNLGGSGYHGVRKAGVTLPSEVRFEDIIAILERIHAGAVTPSGGTVAVTSSSVASPTVITTGAAHSLLTGDVTTIAGHSGSTPSINGQWVVTVLSGTTFSIPIQVTVGGTGGTALKPQTWLYPFEAGSPTIIPGTMETGNIDLASSQERLVSFLVNSLTLGFSPITAGQASPWTLSADCMAFDRAVNALTSALTPMSSPLETVQGHLTRFYEGTVGTAFASLAESAATLRSFTMTAARNLALRAYGSASDLASKFGFTDLSNATYEMLVAVNTTTKSDLHDTWNTSGASLGERRIRLQATGSGSRKFTIDALAGLFAVPWDSSDGERVYKVSGEFADDTTLGASHAISVVNGIGANK